MEVAVLQLCPAQLLDVHKVRQPVQHKDSYDGQARFHSDRRQDSYGQQVVYDLQECSLRTLVHSKADLRCPHCGSHVQL